jgi:UDP-N-acetylglucosamine 2-epimerase (non-hydrolysing)
MMQKVFAIVGTRPEAVKMAPVIEALRRRESHDVKVISTGQHHELLRQTLWSFGIRPDI